ncbi:hypothetical protein ABEW19_29590 [Paenibacillus illinoisensis]|uniref:hypothetical protein n=1 Tax=Paenibacillus illinoisensis TaxID=59845 RepID=UPI003D2C4106
MKKLLATSLLVVPLVFGSISSVSAEEVSSNDFQSTTFEVNSDISHLKERLNYINLKIKTTKDEEKLSYLRDNKNSLEEQISKINKQNEGMFTIQSLNKNVWFAGVGDSAYNSNNSSHEPDHQANIKVALKKASYNGFEWNGTGESQWFGEKPERAYSIENTVTFSATGVAIEGSLSGVSFSGTASGSASVKAARSNAIAAINTFDAYSKATTLSASFTSSSSMIKTSGSATDSTSSQITFYDPGY